MNFYGKGIGLAVFITFSAFLLNLFGQYVLPVFVKDNKELGIFFTIIIIFSLGSIVANRVYISRKYLSRHHTSLRRLLERLNYLEEIIRGKDLIKVKDLIQANVDFLNSADMVSHLYLGTALQQKKNIKNIEGIRDLVSEVQSAITMLDNWQELIEMLFYASSLKRKKMKLFLHETKSLLLRIETDLLKDQLNAKCDIEHFTYRKDVKTWVLAPKNEEKPKGDINPKTPDPPPQKIEITHDSINKFIADSLTDHRKEVPRHIECKHVMQHFPKSISQCLYRILGRTVARNGSVDLEAAVSPVRDRDLFTTEGDLTHFSCYISASNLPPNLDNEQIVTWETESLLTGQIRKFYLCRVVGAGKKQTQDWDIKEELNDARPLGYLIKINEKKYLAYFRREKKLTCEVSWVGWDENLRAEIISENKRSIIKALLNGKFLESFVNALPELDKDALQKVVADALKKILEEKKVLGKDALIEAVTNALATIPRVKVPEKNALKEAVTKALENAVDVNNLLGKKYGEAEPIEKVSLQLDDGTISYCHKYKKVKLSIFSISPKNKNTPLGISALINKLKQVITMWRKNVLPNTAAQQTNNDTQSPSLHDCFISLCEKGINNTQGANAVSSDEPEKMILEHRIAVYLKKYHKTKLLDRLYFKRTTTDIRCIDDNAKIESFTFYFARYNDFDLDNFVIIKGRRQKQQEQPEYWIGILPKQVFITETMAEKRYKDPFTKTPITHKISWQTLKKRIEWDMSCSIIERKEVNFEPDSTRTPKRNRHYPEAIDIAVKIQKKRNLPPIDMFSKIFPHATKNNIPGTVIIALFACVSWLLPPYSFYLGLFLFAIGCVFIVTKNLLRKFLLVSPSLYFNIVALQVLSATLFPFGKIHIYSWYLQFVIAVLVSAMLFYDVAEKYAELTLENLGKFLFTDGKKWLFLFLFEIIFWLVCKCRIETVMEATEQAILIFGTQFIFFLLLLIAVLCSKYISPYLILKKTLFLGGVLLTFFAILFSVIPAANAAKWYPPFAEILKNSGDLCMHLICRAISNFGPDLQLGSGTHCIRSICILIGITFMTSAYFMQEKLDMD